jgi:hypothetical protein
MMEAHAAKIELECRWFRPEDEEGVLALFRSVYDWAPRPESWRWRYGAPADQRLGSLIQLVLDGDRVVAQVCGSRRDVRYGGERRASWLGADFMVHPAYRQCGAFHRLLAFAARHYAENGSFSFGIPNPMHARAAVGLADARSYVPVGGVCGFDPPDGSGGGLHGLSLDLRSARGDFEPDEIALWERVAPARGWALERDAAYLQWRYASPPFVEYQIARIHAGAELVGVAVLHDGWYSGWAAREPRLAVIDCWVAEGSLLGPALDLVLALGCERRLTPTIWALDGEPRAHDLGALGWRARHTGRELVISVFRDDVDLEALRRTATLCLGDVDTFGCAI